MTSSLTTHVLDTGRGAPASGVQVTLAHETPAGWRRVAEAETDADGRCKALLRGGELRAGMYRLAFDVGSYFRARGVEPFWREIIVEFAVKDASAHYHVPLLVSPFGYSTYRGS